MRAQLTACYRASDMRIGSTEAASALHRVPAQPGPQTGTTARLGNMATARS